MCVKTTCCFKAKQSLFLSLLSKILALKACLAAGVALAWVCSIAATGAATCEVDFESFSFSDTLERQIRLPAGCDLPLWLG